MKAQQKTTAILEELWGANERRIAAIRTRFAIAALLLLAGCAGESLTAPESSDALETANKPIIVIKERGGGCC